MSQLKCSKHGCDEIIGRVFPATRLQPEEVDFFPSTVEDDEGYGYCCEEHMQASQPKKEEEDGSSEDESEE